MTWFRNRPRTPKYESRLPHRSNNSTIDDPEVVAAIAREFRRMQEKPKPVKEDGDTATRKT